MGIGWSAVSRGRAGAVGRVRCDRVSIPQEPRPAWCVMPRAELIVGIAHFSILSQRKVEARDVATNFFLHPDSIGSNIADETVK
jgi:hypothetical protein